MPFVDVHDQRIHFDDVGAGPPVVLGHSFLCTGEMWRGQVSALRSRYRVINPEFRGHGQSGPVTAPFSLYDAVRDTVGVLDALEIERAVWCGLSIGGMVGLRAALTVPERVSALVIMDSDAGAEITYRKLKYGAMGFMVRRVGVGPFVPTVSGLMFGATTRREQPELVDEWRQIFAEFDVPSALHCLDALVGRDSLLDQLPSIDVPCLVMVGDEDRSLPPPVSRRINDGLPNSEFVEIRGAGHLSALEQPGQVNDALELFLDRVSGAS